MIASKLLGFAGYLILSLVMLVTFACLFFFLEVLSMLLADGVEENTAKVLTIIVILVAALFAAIPGLQLVSVSEFAKATEANRRDSQQLISLLNTVVDNQERALSISRKQVSRTASGNELLP